MTDLRPPAAGGAMGRDDAPRRGYAATLLRLFDIERRRSVAVWFVPVMVLLGWYISYDNMGNGLKLWGELRTQLGFAVVVIVPVAGAVAAWVAGRERRRGLRESLAAVPAPAFSRDLAAWAGTTFWAVLSFLGVAGGRVAQTALDSTWGGPDLAGIGLGAAAIAAASAFGYLVGGLVPSRFAAVLAAGLLALGENRVDQSVWFDDSLAQYLSPWTYLYSWGFDHDGGSDPFGWALLFWMVGVASALLAGVGLIRARSRASWAGGAAAVAIAVLGAVVAVGVGSGRWRWEVAASREPTPVCVETTISVCVHPAYERFLDETAAVVGAVVAPVVGVPGAPTRAVQVEALRGDPGLDTLQIGILYGGNGNTSDDGVWLAREVAVELVGSYHSPEPAPVQTAVGRWLVADAGFDPGPIDDWITGCSDWESWSGSDADRDLGEPPELPGCRAAVEDTVARFGRMPEGERRAWLERHFADLRAGRVTPGDLS